VTAITLLDFVCLSYPTNRARLSFIIECNDRGVSKRFLLVSLFTTLALLLISTNF